MDSVRFGRVLGIGTRLAAKTVAAAVDAAVAPNPTAKPTASQTTTQTPSQTASRVEAAGQRVGEQTRRKTEQVKRTSQGVKQGGKRFGESVWGPFTKAGRVLWLEFTGVFFGVFAVYGLTEVWRQRSYWRDSPAHHNEHIHLLMGCLMLAIFGYFTFTSFARARHRSRRG